MDRLLPVPAVRTQELSDAEGLALPLSKVRQVVNMSKISNFKQTRLASAPRARGPSFEVGAFGFGAVGFSLIQPELFSSIITIIIIILRAISQANKYSPSPQAIAAR